MCDFGFRLIVLLATAFPHRVEVRLIDLWPPRKGDFLPRVELNAFVALDVEIAEE